jgi:hypothetical protein
MQDCTFLLTCLVLDRPTRQDPFGSIDNLCGNLHRDHHSVNSFLSLLKSILVLPSKSLSPSHNDAKVVNFFHPDFSTPSRRAASLGWEKGLMQGPVPPKVFFLPSDDSNKYNDDDGIATSARGGGGAAPAKSPIMPTYTVGHPFLDVLGHVLKVGRVDVLVFSDFVIRCLTGRHHHFLWRRRRRRRGVGG